MTTAAQIAWDDTVLPFTLDRADTRGRVVRLDRTLHHVLTRHAYPDPVAALVSEATLLTALIGQTIKLRWKLSLQVQCKGPIKLIATDYYGPEAEGAPAEIRAYAHYDDAALEAAMAATPTATGTGPGGIDPFALLGEGMFAMMIDQGPGTTPYKGITPLTGGGLAACAETYFAQSEQLPTRFVLAAARSVLPGGAENWRGGGIMVQQMPKASPHAAGEATGEGGLLRPEDILQGDEAEDWNRVTTLMETAETTELIGPHVSPDTLLVRLFHEEGPRVFDVQPVRFGCSCSAEKVVNSMAIYSARDIAHMTTEDGKVTADCQFCGAHYEFDPAALGFEATQEP